MSMISYKILMRIHENNYILIEKRKKKMSTYINLTNNAISAEYPRDWNLHFSVSLNQPRKGGGKRNERNIRH